MHWHPVANVRRVPNQPATPNRTIRVPDDVWDEALRIARDRGETLTSVIVAALRAYIRQHRVY